MPVDDPIASALAPLGRLGIPGFRRRSLWRAVVAVLGYLLILVLFVRSLPSPLGALVFLAAALAFVGLVTDAWGLRSRLTLLQTRRGQVIAGSVLVVAGLGGWGAGSPSAARPTPTVAPTQPAAAVAPTEAPAPTAAPTVVPTVVPTAAPTAAPTSPPLPSATRPPAVVPTTAPPPLADRNCPDFSTWREAQDFFLQQGGPARDPHQLDVDSDGIACENLPGAPR